MSDITITITRDEADWIANAVHEEAVRAGGYASGSVPDSIDTLALLAKVNNEPTTVALVYGEDGHVHDRCWSWEAGQNYSNMGYRVVAVADVISRHTGEVYMDVDEAQRLYDHERALAADCFGPGIRDDG